VDVFNPDRRAEDNPVIAELIEIDDLGRRQIVLQFLHLAVKEGLAFLGCGVLGVFRNITMGSRLLDIADIPGNRNGLEMVQILQKFVEPRFGDGHFFHSLLLSVRLLLRCELWSVIEKVGNVKGVFFFSFEMTACDERKVVLENPTLLISQG
jgi:hypothetical protein